MLCYRPSKFRCLDGVNAAQCSRQNLYLKPLPAHFNWPRKFLIPSCFFSLTSIKCVNKTMIPSNVFLCRLLYLRFFCLIFLAASPSAMTETNLPELSSEQGALAIQLSSDEILQAFTDVRDDAEVQDTARTRAVNHWLADGRFTNRWSNGEASGEVTGIWRVENDRRCIAITKGLPQSIGQESCGPVFRRGDKYVTFNSDGSIHGIHTLSPLLKPSKPK